MNDGTNIMKALAPGEGAQTREEVTVAFLGREWHVKAYIGTDYNGGAMIIGCERQKVEREKLARQFISAACVVMCGGKEAPDRETLDALLVMLCEGFASVANQLTAYRAARGKPS